MKTPAKLSRRLLLAYSAPGLILTLLMAPFPALFSAFYAKYTAATVAGIAFTLLVARLVDAIVDPSIGYATDHTHTRWGGRKPWIVLGTLVAMLAFYVLLMPSPESGDIRFFFGMLLYYMALAMLDIPMKAWMGEITTDYQERSRMAAYYTSATLIGGAVFMVLPEILSLPAIGYAKTSEMDPDMIATYGMIGMCLLPVMVGIAISTVHQGHVSANSEKHSLGQMFRVLKANRPFWTFLVADGLTQVGYGAFYAVLFIALDTYYRLGDKIAIFLLSVTAAQILSVPAVTWITGRLGKHKTWAWGWLLHVGLLPLIVFFEPGHVDFLLFTAYACTLSALGTPQMMLPMSMINDIADYDSLKSHERRAGIYFSIRMLVYKGTYALGGAAGFMMLSLYAYNPKINTNSPEAAFGMLLALIGIPNLCFLVTSLFLFKYPLDKRRYAIIRKRLDQREKRIANTTMGVGQ